MNNKLAKEQASVSNQIDTIMQNRLRRFKFLLKKDRMDDAMALADEFYEWMLLGEEENEQEEISYYNSDELSDVFDK
jgi:hypothetical protein